MRGREDQRFEQTKRWSRLAHLTKSVQKAQRGDTSWDRYLNVDVTEIEDYIGSGSHMTGWYRHLNGGWRLDRGIYRARQYMEDEEGRQIRPRAQFMRIGTALSHRAGYIGKSRLKSYREHTPQPKAVLSGDPPALKEHKGGNESYDWLQSDMISRITC